MSEPDPKSAPDETELTDGDLEPVAGGVPMIHPIDPMPPTWPLPVPEPWPLTGPMSPIGPWRPRD